MTHATLPNRNRHIQCLTVLPVRARERQIYAPLKGVIRGIARFPYRENRIVISYNGYIRSTHLIVQHVRSLSWTMKQRHTKQHTLNLPISLRSPVACLSSPWYLRALALLHPYLLPLPSPRVGWCGVLGFDSCLGPFPCRADRFAVVPIRSFLHQHPLKGVERPHAQSS